MGQVEMMEPVKTVQESDILQMLESEPGLRRALAEWKAGRLSGKIEIHFSQGGIAKIYGEPKFTYK